MTTTTCTSCGAHLAPTLIAAIADPNQPESCPTDKAQR